MATDAWEQVKQRLVRLFARAEEAAAVGRDLDESRDALAAAAGTPDEEDLVSDVTAMVRLRLRRLLRQDPAAADELRRLLQELTPSAEDGETGAVHNSITGGTQYGPVIQGRSFSNLTFHASGTATSDQ
ncbi:hypothetical protein ABZX30_09435 [Streptomyces sp. NPDC004542]|uniref:hypothetical protein n=1 Tax=Streptomyces sp. NPDC004542 TaxID=3154281 RepID=UPI0033B9AA23